MQFHKYLFTLPVRTQSQEMPEISIQIVVQHGKMDTRPMMMMTRPLKPRFSIFYMRPDRDPQDISRPRQLTLETESDFFKRVPRQFQAETAALTSTLLLMQQQSTECYSVIKLK